MSEIQIGQTMNTSLIEEHIFNDILKNDNAKKYIFEFKKNGINKSLEKIFLDINEENNTINFEPYSLKRLFDFALREATYSVSRSSSTILMEEIMQLFLRLIGKIEEWLELNRCEHENNMTSRLRFNNFRELYNEMLDFYQNRKIEDVLYIEKNIWNYLARSWDLIGSELITYKILSKLEQTMSDYNGTDLMDWEFIELVNDITK